MRLIIFGASGNIGKHSVDLALAAGHQVRAFSRHPATLDINHPNLSLWPGGVFNLSSAAVAIRGCNGVLVALGSSKLSNTFRSVPTRNIVQAMQ